MDVTSLAAQQSSGPSTQSFSRLTQDFDTFLTLLTTQLRNQDPLEPLDTEKFTEQLVQFAGVEQSIQTNQHLEALLALQTASSNETALAMVGRIANVETDVATLTNESARWTYELPANAAASNVNVVDARGAVVAVLNGAATPGQHNVIWDGKMNNGGRAPEGAYRLVIDAIDADGAPVSTSITSRGRVDAVAFDDGAPKIEIAGQRFDLDLVKRIDAAL
ncbi:MAG: hypothetical protein KJN99_07905 [Marinicaulis sp.]|nr:hypothetical protein [Marinicaulis sp.]